MNSKLAELVICWSSLISMVEGGYSWCIDDYYYELTARDSIQKILNHAARMSKEIDHKLIGEINMLDARFKKCLIPDLSLGDSKDPWWHRSVPKEGGKIFAEDVLDTYDIHINIIDV